MGLERLLRDAEFILVSDGREADEIDHAVEQSFDLQVDFLVPFFLDGVEVFCRILVYQRLRCGPSLEEICSR